ncbi:ATP-binding protein [Massilia luteola]|uniref:ATP-binding protein n=1 Tax=Massilia luteola TaxID=3081751 RepID=UPI002ACBFF05|nr:NB-ARC domain-containing protein [Massilia sp. Gc5]
MRTPAPDLRILGRSAELARVAELLQERRFVTIVGPGGMGKTTVARALARECADLYPDGVRFIDLAIMAEDRELVGALGAALGMTRLTRDGLAQLAPCLRGRRMLVVFDCCEHHTAVAAEACEALLRAASGIDVLCTSREPLLARSERIVRLRPMGMPNAVELFVARAHGDHPDGFFLDSGNVALVRAICRAVDGVPLALELAAALVRPLGLDTVARQTSRCLLASSPVRVHAGDRHDTLASMLDWSYDMLSPAEQRVLRCLAVFRGGFTLEAAGAVAAAVASDTDNVIDTVIELAGKSLVSTNAGGADRPRLLDLTRDYVYDKLVRSGELDAVRQRHARWLGTLMDRIERDWMELARCTWLDLYGPWIDDILAAIDWALGPGGEPLLGARLAGTGFSLGDQIGIAREFQGRVQRAVEAVGNLEHAPARVLEILWRLNAVVADGRDLSGHSYRKLMDDAGRNLLLARKAGTAVLQSFPLMAMWGWPYVRADYPASLAGAEHMARAARDSRDPYLALLAQRTLAQSLHYLGRHAEARQWATMALSSSGLRIPLSYLPSPVQVATSMRIVLARVLWMEGAADQALAMSEQALASAEQDRPVALCQALCLAAAPVAIWRGELALAAALVARLRDCAEGHGLGFWLDWARRYEGALAVMAGTIEVRDLAAFADTHEFSAKCRDQLVTFSPMLLAEDAAMRGASGLVAWCLPELLRARALRRLAADPVDRDGAAAALLHQALETAQRHGAPAWALRSATSLAAVYRRQDTGALARAVLEPTLARCREGYATADLRAATALLASLG